MKNWIATYTEDKGVTYKTMTVQEISYTQAYIAVALKTEGIITDLKEVIPSGTVIPAERI